MKKIPALDEEANKRIDAYAVAIRHFGLQELLNKLKEAHILESDYKYNTFKTQFRRLKENKSGPFLKTNFLIPILQHLDGFTYKDLFGEDETGKNEQENKESSVLNAISELKTELKNDLSTLHKGGRAANSRDYIKGKNLLESTKEIAMRIDSGLKDSTLGYYALINIFVQYTLPQKKTWKHGSSKMLGRIDKIFNQMTKTNHFGQVYSLEVLEGHKGPDFSDLPHKQVKINNLGNYYLVIAYQMLLLDELYRLYSKNDFCIKFKTVNNGNNYTKITVWKIKIRKEYKDNASRDAFRSCIKNFYSIFDDRLNEYFKIDIRIPSVPSNEYLVELQNIILQLNGILFRFAYPSPVRKHGFSAGTFPETLDFLLQRETSEENYEVILTDKDLITFNEIFLSFERLECQETTTEQDKTEETDFSKMKIKGIDGKPIIPHFVNVKRT